MNEDHRELFVREAEERLDELVDAVRAMERGDTDAAADRVFRNVHTLKGNCQAMGFEELARLAHAIEDCLDAIRNGGISASPEILDLLVEGVDRIRTGIAAIAHGNETTCDPGPLIDAFGQVVDHGSPADLAGSRTSDPTILDRDSDRGGVVQVDRADVSRPIEEATTQLPAMVQTLAGQQDKEVHFSTDLTDLTIDRRILRELRDSLLHVVRNAVDHGIEPPGERTEAGKSREGTIRLRARRDGGHLEIAVHDDGRGLDVDAIRTAAIERDLYTSDELAVMAPTELRSLILSPGVSTKDVVTPVSGRGVGLDVVASTMADLDGSVAIESTPGAGTTVTLRCPVDPA